MTIQEIAAIGKVSGAAGGGMKETAAGADLSLSDLSRLDHAVYSEQGRLDTVAVTQVTPVERAMVKPLDAIDSTVKSFEQAVDEAVNRTEPLMPVDSIKLMASAHTFAFQTQLVASVANKTSDGVSQLFRQQS